MDEQKAVEPGHESIFRRGIGPALPEADADTGAETPPIMTSPVDPDDPELRRWFVDRSRELQAEREQTGEGFERQRPIPDFVAEAPAGHDTRPFADGPGE